MDRNLVSIRLTPDGQLDILSKAEVAKLLDTSRTGLYHLYRMCSLAVLNSGIAMDNAAELLSQYESFDIRLLQQDRGLRLELSNAPGVAFVDGKIIEGIKQLLFTVLRDIIYVSNEIHMPEDAASDVVTGAVFHILRNADALQTKRVTNLAVCWGGHSIGREEYDYTKEVGYQLGLRGIDICTGCGAGAMKGPMKGATIGHAKQRNPDGRYLGISEPGIIAAEPPNPIINELIIMPDIEKRLEAFVRMAHSIVVFPGGVGTAEEILYLIGLLLHPKNKNLPFPIIFTGPAGSAAYFDRIDQFVGSALGEDAQSLYKIIIDDPQAVASEVRKGVRRVRKFRKARDDAYYFNWLLHIERDFQQPFNPSRESMTALDLNRDQEPYLLAANLRRAFSGIVAGNVKEEGIRAVQEGGVFELNGDPDLMGAMDKLLESFVDQGRMKLPGGVYTPCYRIANVA
ncbi:MAG TPA: LOG family protein [Gammaproteobacteria bacterium]|nr:LOG family protein [Gammaproteobacteria bacterium]